MRPTVRWWIGGALLLSLITLASSLPAQSNAPKADQISVKVVDYAELGKIIQGLKGQVVVVDLWNIT